nr:hypothetical protein [Kofleriaceae bacterium]
MLIVILAAGVAAADPSATKAAPATTPPAEPSLWQVEINAGYGVDINGGAGAVGMRASPLTLQGTIAIAVNQEPLVYGYGGMMVETLDRGSVGVVAGARLQPEGSSWHLAGGGAYVFDPYTLWGAQASAGACSRHGKTMSLCGDFQITAYFTGSDLGMKRDVTQAQLALGVMFDAP